MIAIANESMLPRLKRIWQTCFEDTPQGTELVFGNLLAPDQMLVWVENNRPVAMINWKMLRFTTPRAAFKGAYVFGVATLPEYRGKGISKTLMEALHPILQQQGAALSCLVPASESLFDFYGSQGYITTFRYKMLEHRPDADSSSGGVLSTCSLAELEQERNKAFSQRRLFGAWDREYLHFADQECRFYGGEVLRFSAGGRNGYAVCYGGKEVLAKEVVVAPQDLPLLLNALHNRYGAQIYRLRLPEDFPVAGKMVLPFAMVKWYDMEKAKLAGGTLGGSPWFAFGLD